MSDTVIRSASPEDAPALAELIDTAGEGIPRWLWAQSAGPGESAIEVGRRRAGRAQGGFSYRNAHILEVRGEVAGMLLGYRLPDPYDAGDPSSLPDVVRPLVELEALAPGSWYVNAVAVFDAFRGNGYGTRLMRLAHELAEASGAERSSLIVAEENEGARRLYERLGYEVRARRPVVPFEGFEHGGDWVLMLRPLLEDRAAKRTDG